MKGPILIAIIDDTELWSVSVKRFLQASLPSLDYDVVVEEFRDTDSFLIQWHQGYRPHAIKCDMRIVGDMKGPEKLYNYLKSIGEERRMFFATAHLSIHDEQVRVKTGAEIIIKDNVNDDSFLHKLISMCQ